MNSPADLVGAAETPTSRVSEGGRTRVAIVGWAFLVWLTSVVAYGLVMLTAKNFVRSHTWSELLVFDSTIVIGSLLLIRRDHITWKAAGIALRLSASRGFRT
jgi:hypothetical protein